MLQWDARWLLAGLAVSAWIIHATRRWNRVAWTCLSLGSIVISLAIAGLGVARDLPARVCVLVDLSPSTRVADYRARATLDAMIDRVLPKGRTSVMSVDAFGGSLTPLPLGDPLTDMPGHTTGVQSTLDTDAILLFSDGRFDPPASSPPIFAVIDPGLIAAEDSAVRSLETRDDQIWVSVRTSCPRTLQIAYNSFDTDIDGDAGPAKAASISPGAHTRSVGPITESASSVAVGFSPADAYPENDMLTTAVTAPLAARGWIGNSPPRGWTRIDPIGASNDPSAWAGFGVIGIDSTAAGSLALPQQAAIADVVNHWGSAVLWVGCPPTSGPLATMSSLSGDPPSPQTPWVVLWDQSGSMATAVGGLPRADRAIAAAAELIDGLPPLDRVYAGAFAQGVELVADGLPAVDAARKLRTLPAAAPRGPTLLAEAMDEMLRRVDGNDIGVVLLTDTAAEPLDAGSWIDRLGSRRIHLHVLAFGHGRAHAQLERIAVATGGSMQTATDPNRWNDAARALALEARPLHAIRPPMHVEGVDALRGLTLDVDAGTCQAWTREGSTLLAAGTATSTADDASRRPTSAGGSTGDPSSLAVAAVWAVGAGRFCAITFRPGEDWIERLSDAIAGTPEDPRFKSRLVGGREERITIIAADRLGPINSLTLTAWVRDRSTTFESDPAPPPVEQIAPGTYQLSVPRSRRLRMVEVYADGKAVSRIVIPARADWEFDEIGLDRGALERLAEQTGGGVIDPNPPATDAVGAGSPYRASTTPAWPLRRVNVPLSTWMAALGGSLIATGLLAERVRGKSVAMTR